MLALKFSSLMTYNVQKRHSMKLFSEELLRSNSSLCFADIVQLQLHL